MTIPSHKILVPLLLFFLGVTGCTTLAANEQPVRTHFEFLESGSNLGQTFVSRFDGLEEISVYLAPQSPGNGDIILRLSQNPNDVNGLRSSAIELDEIKDPGFYTFSFPTIKNSAHENFFFHLELDGSGTMKVGAADGTLYLNGALYSNHEPQDAQITFLLNHHLGYTIIGLLKEILNWVVILLGSVFLFILPGWGLLGILWRNWYSNHWGEKLGLSAGMSLALYPLVYLWASLFGIKLGPLFPWFIGGIGVLLVIWGYREKILGLPGVIQKSDYSITCWISSIQSYDLIFLGVMALVFISRFWLIRSLYAPIGSDPIHHTMITQLIIDNGGLFNSWEPYSELQSFTYHFGFHSAAASFQWLFGLHSQQAVLWLGQLLNGLAVIAVFPLAKRIGRSPWSGVSAVLLAGLLSHMPNYFLNWGRYTHLTALIIMPAAVYMVWDLLTCKNFKWNIVSPVIVIWSGLALTHYRVMALGLIFIPTLWMFNKRLRSIGAMILRTIGIGLGIFLLTLPWIIHTFIGKTPDLLAKIFSTPLSARISTNSQFESVGDLSIYLSIFLWVLLLIGLGWGLWNHNRGIAIIGVWWFLAYLVANPHFLNLPGKGALSNKIVLYSLYLPASIIIGAFVGWLIESTFSKKSKAVKSRVVALGIFTILIVLAVWGTYLRFQDLRKHEILVTQPDVTAMEWIEANTGKHTKFLVNSYFGFGLNWIIGNDGGWWLPLLANRKTNLPPMVYVVEKGPKPDYAQWASLLPLEINEKGITHPEVVDLMQDRDITHLYIGQLHGGREANDNLLALDELVSDPKFELVYHQDRVWVFEIVN